jgi:hypothetical protein
MFRKPRRPRPSQPRNTPNPSRHSTTRPQQTGQIQSLGAPMPATVHPAITAFGLGPGKLVWYADVSTLRGELIGPGDRKRPR